jgi:hypothetical protein
MMPKKEMFPLSQATAYDMKNDFYGLEFVDCKEFGKLAVILDIKDGQESIIQMTTDKRVTRITMEEAQKNFDSGKWTVSVPSKSEETI